MVYLAGIMNECALHHEAASKTCLSWLRHSVSPPPPSQWLHYISQLQNINKSVLVLIYMKTSYEQLCAFVNVWEGIMFLVIGLG